MIIRHAFRVAPFSLQSPRVPLCFAVDASFVCSRRFEERAAWKKVDPVRAVSSVFPRQLLPQAQALLNVLILFAAKESYSFIIMLLWVTSSQLLYFV